MSKVVYIVCLLFFYINIEAKNEPMQKNSEACQTVKRENNNTFSLQLNTHKKIRWLDFNEGYAKAKIEKKIALLDCYTDWCYWCKRLDKDTYSDTSIIENVNANFVAIKFNPEKTEMRYVIDGKVYNGMELLSILSNGQASGYPTTFFINTKENKMLSAFEGYANPVVFLKVLQGKTLSNSEDNGGISKVPNDPNWYASGGDSKVKTDTNWKASGTGFFINNKGYISTNYHVIEGARVIEVEVIQNGQKKSLNAKVISSDKQNDLSIIKIDDNQFIPFPKLPYNFKTQLSEVGADVFTLGYPLAFSGMGNEVKFTDGKISSKTGFEGSITTYQISVPVQPGSSGGPLFDYDGNIIGVVNAKITAAENVSYAIKSSYLKSLLDVLYEKVDITNDQTLMAKSLIEKIKLFSDFVVLIKVK